MKFFLVGIFIFWSSQLFAAGKVNYLNVEDNTLFFTLDTLKSHAVPSCALPANEKVWTISLNNQTGLSSYNTLLMAVANNLKVRVLTAGDCGVSNGYERAKSVALIK